MINMSNRSPVGIPENVPDVVVADMAADIARLEHLNLDNPHRDFAQHVVAMLGATACAMAKGTPGNPAAVFGAETLEHVCGMTAEAAIWLLGRLFATSGMDAEDVVRTLPAYMSQALDS